MPYVCASCGEYHDERVLDIGAEVPDRWLEASFLTRLRSKRVDSAARVRERGGDRFFLRGLIELPVPELEDTFRYGAWVEVSEADFERAVELWDEQARAGEPPYRGHLDTSLPGYPETVGLPVTVHEQEADRAPSITIEAPTHPLALEQREGITVKRLDEIVAPFMHAA